MICARGEDCTAECGAAESSSTHAFAPKGGTRNIGGCSVELSGSSACRKPASKFGYDVQAAPTANVEASGSTCIKQEVVSDITNSLLTRLLDLQEYPIVSDTDDRTYPQNRPTRLAHVRTEKAAWYTNLYAVLVCKMIYTCKILCYMRNSIMRLLTDNNDIDRRI